VLFGLCVADVLVCCCECEVEGEKVTSEVADEGACYKDGERAGGSVVEVGWLEL
jgi:hypothetical protein